MSRPKGLVHGVGINDADYVTQIMETVGRVEGRQKQKLVWICPFYSVWRDMIKRCYSDSYQTKYPTYKGCKVCDDWKYFSKFKSWMETQDWGGKQLDKDLLVKGNKIYSPITCVFVSGRINNFLVERGAGRGKYPIGVSYMKRENMVNELSNPYQARAQDITGKSKHLGMFTTPEEAHQAWLKAKLELAKEIAAEILDEGGDPRIAKAIVERYENYSSE